MKTLNQRIPFVMAVMVVLAGALVIRLLSFQFRLDPAMQEQFERLSGQTGTYTQTIQPDRGEIYDRDGVILAVNSFQYRIGISPGLINPGSRQEVAVELAAVLNMNEAEIYRLLQPDHNDIFPRYVMLNTSVDTETGQRVEDLGIPGVLVEPIPLRSYPQGALTAQIVGFVNYSEKGFYGVEGRYDKLLAGSTREIQTEGGLFELAELPEARDGQSLVLTIDRDIQYVIQQVLTEAIATYKAQGGLIIVMNPRNGEILAMQAWPILDHTEFLALPLEDQRAYNPVVSDMIEPGSIIKVVTAAITLQAGVPGLDVNWTYNNTGCFEKAGVQICDWDRVPKGNVDFRNCLIQSLNTCTATWYSLLGPSKVYSVLQDFGFGHETGVDLQGEAAGIINLPGSTSWSEANFLNISYGQGISVTPLQMLNAVNAIANGGLLMQPHVVKRRYDGNNSFEIAAVPVARPISAEVARMVTEIMVETVEQGESGTSVSLPGYRIAGKTGTAQQPVPGGYSSTDSWASFVGFLPADDPMVSILVVLDRPEGYWGSQTAAPVFRQVVERLVVLLEIPPDDIRTHLVDIGGDVFKREYE